jgi:hypothetical protein
MSDREDDLTLMKFLRQHQGVSPPPAPNLECRIMQAVATCPRLSRYRRYLWMVPSAIAATSLLAWMSSQFFIDINKPLETAELEEFWLENWEYMVREPTLQNRADVSTTLLADELLNSDPSLDSGVFYTELTSNKR